MNLSRWRFKIPVFSLQKLLAAEPPRYWNNFLWFLLVLLILVLLFDLGMFWKLTRLAEGKVVQAPTELLDTAGLERALRRIDEKKNNFEKYLGDLKVEDPS